MYCCFYNPTEKRYITLDCATTSHDMMSYMTTHGWVISEYRSYR